MRKLNLSIEHSLFCTIHHKSAQRPDGYTEGDLEEINEDLEDGDVLRWRRELAAHFAKS